MNRYVLEILNKRGIEDADEFLSSSPRLAHDPLLMKNMSEGVKLVRDHIRRGSLICIYGDYDTDGVTSSAILATALQKAGGKFFVYIPNRKEGYGLNMKALKDINSRGADLIITVDCGCSDLEEAAYARERGMDILITDHHTVSGRAPGRYFINPKYEDSGYPFRDLAGCGVAFKLASALSNDMGLDVKRELLDLAAIGTIGDIVPLLDENRTIVKYGLKALRQGKRKGLAALADIIGQDLRQADEEYVGYYIAPHLNAAGRVDDPMVAYRLLMAADEGEARMLAEKLSALNQRRRELQREAAESIEARDIDRWFTVAEVDKKYEGVAGIVAGNIKDRFNVPALLLTGEGDMLKGSARGIAGTDLYSIIATQKERLASFGGHARACGVEVARSELPYLTEGLRQEMRRIYAGNPRIFSLSRDYDISPAIEDIDHDFYSELRLLAPFGAGNSEPVLLLRGHVKEYRRIGAEGKHLRLVLEDGRGNYLKALKWNVPEEMYRLVSQGGDIRVLGNLKEDNYRGRPGVRLEIEEIFI